VRRMILLTVVALLMVAPRAQATPIVAGQTILTFFPIQDIELLPNTFLNPGSSSILLDHVTAFGQAPFDRQAQTGSTIHLTNGRFDGTGFNPALGTFELFSLHLSITITNVVQNPNDPGFASGNPSSFASGDVVFNVADFGARLANGLLLTVKDPFLFDATFDGLPPSPGTLYLSNPFDKRLDIYATDPGTGQEVVVAQSFHRYLVEAASVPEPSSLLLLGVGAAGAAGYGWRRKRAA
jgi:PEP-CTERM motif